MTGELIQTYVVITSPDLGKRGTAKAFKSAIDNALLDWRASALPKHFRPSAIALYGGEYRKHRQTAKQANYADRIRKMSQGERARWYAERRKLQARTARFRPSNPGMRNLDPTNKIPLVRTGRLRLLATRGPVRHTGPTKMRALTLSGLPGYVHSNRSNQIHKANAIKTFNATDTRRFNAEVDREIAKYFRTTKKIRGA